MNDAINKLRIRMIEQLSIFNEQTQREMRAIIDDLIELEIKRVKRMQLLEVRGYQLRKDDLIFDPNGKTLHKISYVAKRTKCQFNVPKNNTEILVMYGEDEPTDYFDIHSELYILVDIGEIVHINKRTIDGIMEDGGI